MFRTTLKNLGAHKRRLLSTCTAVLLGVAFLSGTLVIGDTMRSGFADIFAEANAGTDAYVRSDVETGDGEWAQRGLLAGGTVDAVRAVDGVAVAEPVVEATGQIVGADGDPLGGNGPPTMAGNWLADDGLRPWDLAEGRAPEADGEVVIDRGSATDGDLAIGDTITIRTPAAVQVELVGIATFQGGDNMAGSTLAAFTTGYAQQLLLSDPTELTAVAVAGDGSVTQAELADRIEAAMPGGVEALTGAELTAEQEQEIQDDFVGFVENALLVFAGVALVVATFSIYNTFSILVAQRTRESALLRALGASRRQVITSVVIEALIVGLVASGLGIAAGLGLAYGLTELAQSTMDWMNNPLAVGPAPIVAGLTVGLVVTLVASLAPAVRASRVKPLAALRDVAIDRSATSRVRSVLGVLATAGGVALAVAGTGGDGSLSLTGLGALVTLVGVILLGPVAARPAAGLLGAPFAARRKGTSAKLARQNAMRNPRRTASTASALMVGVAVVSLFTVLGASIKTSMDDIVNQSFAGDLVIAQDDFSGAGMTPDLGRDIDALPEVESAVGIGTAAVRVGDTDFSGTYADLPAIAQFMDLELADGSFDDLGAGTIALGTDWAEERGWGVGDRIPVAFPDGAVEELTLGATYDMTQLMGPVILPTEAWAPHAGQLVDEVIAVDLADGVSTGDGQRAIQPLADRYGAPEVMDRDEYIASVAGQVDELLTIVYVMLILAILIALMGIANTLALSIHERTRELGLLRAVGQTRRQVRTMVRGESMLVALFGTIGGVGLGAFLAWSLTQALASQDFGAFTLPVGQLAFVLVLGALVGVIAAVRPARRAARLDVLQAIATD
jgi:putative ABC transport system permease protein